MMGVVIHTFLLCRHLIFIFSTRTPAAVKAFGVFAIPINQIGSFSVRSELAQK